MSAHGQLTDGIVSLGQPGVVPGVQRLQQNKLLEAVRRLLCEWILSSNDVDALGLQMPRLSRTW